MKQVLFDASSVKPTSHSVRLRMNGTKGWVFAKKYTDPETGSEAMMKWFTLEFEPLTEEDLLFVSVRTIASAVTSFQPKLFAQLEQLVSRQPADWDGAFPQRMKVRVYDVALPFSYWVKFKDGRKSAMSSISIVAIADEDANKLFERAYKEALKNMVASEDSLTPTADLDEE